LETPIPVTLGILFWSLPLRQALGSNMLQCRALPCTPQNVFFCFCFCCIRAYLSFSAKAQETFKTIKFVISFETSFFSSRLLFFVGPICVRMKKERKKGGKIKKHNGVKYDGLASGNHKFLVTNVPFLFLCSSFCHCSLQLPLFLSHDFWTSTHLEQQQKMK
jgi:hypothetical protein